MSSSKPGFLESQVPGYKDVKDRVESLAKGDKKEWMRSGRETLMAQTAAAMIGNVPTVLSTGSIAPLITNTIAQPLLAAIPVLTGPLGAGLGVAVGAAYLGNKRRKYVNKMFAEGKNWNDIREADFKNVAAAPARPIWEGINLGVSLVNGIMVPGGKLDKTLDAVADRGKGTYKGEILEPVDKALSFIERITDFNPAHAFIPDRERKKAADKGEEVKKAA